MKCKTMNEKMDLKTVHYKENKKEQSLKELWTILLS